MVMILTVFFFLVLMPVLLVFIRWTMVHRQANTLARVQTKEYFGGLSGADATRYLIQNVTPGCPGTNCWDPGNTLTRTILIDSGTVVTIQMTNVGTP